MEFIKAQSQAPLNKIIKGRAKTPPAKEPAFQEWNTIRPEAYKNLVSPQPKIISAAT